MKKYLLCLCFIIIESYIANAQNVLTEDFIFDPIDSLENSGDWRKSGIDSKYNIKIVTPGLIYKDYIGSERGNSCQIANSGNGDIVYRNLSSDITSGAAFMSFLIKVDSLPATVTAGYCIGFNPNTGGTNLNTMLTIKRLSDSTFNFGVGKNTSLGVADYNKAVYRVHKTYLAVLKYSIINGISNDSAIVYIFENGVPKLEPIIPSAATIVGDDYTGQGSVFLSNNYAQSGFTGCNIKVDGIRVGNSWATSVLAMLSSTSFDEENSNFINQNYPNPFHQETQIKYQIPTRGNIRIDIFNDSGIHCLELLNEIKEGGQHELNWNAEKFSAGSYICRVQFNGTVLSHILVKIN